MAKKKILINSSVFFMLIMFSSTKIIAQQKNEFTVKQAADYGIKNSVAVRNALIDIKIQKQTNNEFTANAYPQLSASGSGNHYFNTPIQPIPDFIKSQIYGILQGNGVVNGNTGQPIVGPNSFPDLPFSVVQPWSAGASLDLSQIIFDGQVFIGLKARKTAMELATKTSEVTAEQIKANIYKIYYQLAVGKKQVGSIEANIERFEKLLNDTKEIYKQGFAEKLDVDKAQVQLNNLRTEKLKINNQLETGNAGLKFLMNMPQKDVLILTDTVSEEALKENILDEAYDYKNRKEVQLLALATKLNEYNVRRYKLSKLPSLVAFGSYQKNAQRQKFDFFEKGDWFTTSLVGLKLSVPLFDGGARSAKIKKAQFEVAKLNNNLEQTKASIDYDVNNARIKMTTALLTIDNQKQNVTLAEKVFNTTKKKYEAGLGSNQEIYNAQTELKVAQTNYYAALYDAVIAKVDYLQAVGKL